jgi:hypothetical protein
LEEEEEEEEEDDWYSLDQVPPTSHLVLRRTTSHLVKIEPFFSPDFGHLRPLAKILKKVSLVSKMLCNRSKLHCGYHFLAVLSP